MNHRAALAVLLTVMAASARAEDSQPPQSPEQATQSLQDTFRRLSSPRASLELPSYADVQREKRRAEFAPEPSSRPEGSSSMFPMANRNSAEYLYQGATRHITKAAEGYFLHAAGGRIDVGAGYADMRDRDGNAYFNHEIPKYGVLRLNFGKLGKREKRTFVPSGSYTETEVSPKLLVSPHEITVDSVRRAVKDASAP